MTHTRRQFMATAAASAAGITVLPWAANAAAHAGNMFETGMGEVTVHPISHASFVMETPAGVIYVDPVGDVAQYEEMPAADMVLITHEHGDHYNADTLAGIAADKPMIVNPAVMDMLPEAMKANATAMANGDSMEWEGITIDAIPAHNLTEERMNFHPKGRDNGYVLTMGDFRVYISGDTEDVPEMRALEDIDVAFVCMNLPFTMDAATAADAVAEFKPTYVYPYHYRGRDGGTQDPEEFARLVGDAAEVRMGGWYKEGELG